VPSIADSLKQAGVEKLDAELLLSDVLHVPRSVLLARSKESLSSEQNIHFKDFCERRKKGEPVAYILGKKEFYGMSFGVSPAVLIPRPATEGLIDVTKETLLTKKAQRKETDTKILAKSWILKEDNPTVIVDIGTGSGAIAIILAHLFPSLPIIATDISIEALAIAIRNAWGNDAQIDIRHGSLLEPVMDLQEPFFVVSNPPYIPEGEKLLNDVSAFEPHEALFAGKDGLSVITPLIDQCKKHPFCTGVTLEFRSDQERMIDSFLKN
jgi:release factor glutamine methyltransferase